MKPGKISENVRNRSVLKITQPNSLKNMKSAPLGEKCAFFSSERAVCTQVLSLPIAENLLMRHAIFAAVNKLFCENVTEAAQLPLFWKDADNRLDTLSDLQAKEPGEKEKKWQLPIGLSFGITLAERTREAKLKAMMQEASEIASEYGMTILGGHTESSETVKSPVVSVTAIWMRSKEDKLGKAETAEQNKKTIEKNQKSNPSTYTDKDIVVAGYIGLEAAAMLAYSKEADLLRRFPKVMVSEAQGFEKRLPVIPEAAIAIKSGACFVKPIREGGIFASLWDMGEQTGTGLAIKLLDIPMKQTVVEFCNHLDLNPYEITSEGALLILAEDGEALVAAFEEEDTVAAVIGKTTGGNDRIIENGEEVRYLDLPAPDQIRKILK